MPRPRSQLAAPPRPGARIGIRRTVAALLWTAAILNSWFLLALVLPHDLPAAGTFVSELTATGQPHAELLRRAELATGVALFAALALGWPRSGARGFVWLAGAGLALFALCTAADSQLPLDCTPTIDAACRAAERAGEVSAQHAAHTVTGVLESVAMVMSSYALSLGTRYSRAWAATSRLAAASGNLQVVLAAGVSALWWLEWTGIGVLQRVSVLAFSALLGLLAATLWRHPWPASGPPAWPDLRGAANVTTVAVPGGCMQVQLHHFAGPGPPVVFSNGLGLPGALWYPVVARLPELPCVIFDRPGLGDSSGQAGADLAEQVAQLRGAIAAGWPHLPGPAHRRVVLVAHSHGAIAAQVLAREDPQLVAALILVDPAVPRAAHRLELAGQLVLVALGRLGAALPLGAAIAGRIQRAVVLGLGRAMPDAQRPDGWLRTQLATGRHLLAVMAELEQEPADMIAARASGSTLPSGTGVGILAADRSGWPLYRRNRRWLARMARLAVELGAPTPQAVPGAHLLMLDAPDAVAAEIRGAWAQVPPRQSP